MADVIAHRTRARNEALLVRGLGPPVSATGSAASVADSHDCRQHDRPGPEQHLADLFVTRGTWTDAGHVKWAIFPGATWYDEQRLYSALGY